MAREQKVQVTIDGKDNTAGAFGSVEKNLASLEKRTAVVGKAMVGAFAGVVSIATLKRIADTNMEFRKLDRVLRENTESQEDFNYAQKETTEIADQLGVSLDGVVNNFGKMNGSMAALGYSSKEALRVTETISKLMTLEGADPSATIARFTRMLSKGELHGARFNLMLQDQPALLDLVSKATGKTIDELRQLAETGQLTAHMFTDAILGMGEHVDEKFKEMPSTIEQAMNRIHGNIADAFRDEGLMQPIVDSLDELADILKDPDVRQGLASLATALAKLAGGGAEALAELGDGAASADYRLRQMSGATSDLEDLEHQLKQVERSLKNTGMSTTLGGMMLSTKYLEEQKARLEDLIFLMEEGAHDALQLDKEIQSLRSRVSDPITSGYLFDGKQLLAAKEEEFRILLERTREQKQQEETHQTMLKDEREKEGAIHRKYVADLKTYNEQALKAVEDRGKELAKAEKDAAKKILDAKKEAETLLKQFDDIRKEIAGGGAKEPSYGEYQRLATMARQALAAGDTEKAKENALAAANVLKELAAAGGNTFGFEGMVKSMQEIAKSATDIEQADAEAELEKIKAEMADLAEQAAALKEMPVSMQADEASLEAVKNQITALLEKLKIEAVIPVRMETSGAVPAADDSVPGYATGGHIRGPGTSTSDSILARLSNGEFVMRAAAVRKYGLDMLHRMNNMQIPQFATGGLVEQVANIESRQPQSVGTLNFNLPGGESFSVNTVGDFSEDLRRAALKYGKPRR